MLDHSVSSLGANFRKGENVSSSNMPELSANELRYRCPLDRFAFETTEEIDAPFEIIAPPKSGARESKRSHVSARRGSRLRRYNRLESCRRAYRYWQGNDSIKSILGEQGSARAQIPSDDLLREQFRRCGQPCSSVYRHAARWLEVSTSTKFSFLMRSSNSLMIATVLSIPPESD